MVFFNIVFTSLEPNMGKYAMMGVRVRVRVQYVHVHAALLIFPLCGYLTPRLPFLGGDTPLLLCSLEFNFSNIFSPPPQFTNLRYDFAQIPQQFFHHKISLNFRFCRKVIAHCFNFIKMLSFMKSVPKVIKANG